MTGYDSVDPAVARLLEDPAVWVEVPAGLRERTLAEAAGIDALDGIEEIDGIDGIDAVVTRPAFGPSRPAWWRRPPVLAAAAVLVVALAVAGGLQLRGGSDAGGVEVALGATKDAPGATAVAELRDEPSGVSVVLDVRGLPAAPAGTFYEAWLVGPSGKVSAGTFHERGRQDHIRLWLGVDPGAYDAITVTRQPVAGGSTAPGVVMLRGELPDHI